MFECNAPQFYDFQRSDDDNSIDAFFDTFTETPGRRVRITSPSPGALCSTNNLCAETKTPRRRTLVRSPSSGLGVSRSAKKHSMVTRQDAKDEALCLRSRSIQKNKLETDESRENKSSRRMLFSLTVPVTPHLLTKARKRPTAIPYEERVLLEVEEFKRNNPMPVPLKKEVLKAPPPKELPHSHTVPVPFNITELKKKERQPDNQEVFVFKALPLPSTHYNKPCNVVKPFRMKKSIKKKSKSPKTETVSLEDVENYQPFRAKKARVLSVSPFRPRKSTRPPLTPDDVILQTAIRAQVRASFNARRDENLRRREMMLKQMEELKAQELKEHRETLVHKPRPLPREMIRARKRRAEFEN